MAEPTPPHDQDRADRPGTIVIRTHYLNEALFQQAASLRQGGRYTVLFAIDERRQRWDSRGFGKISLTKATFARLGLSCDDPSFLWRFGDYVFYAARAAEPTAAFVWLVENDVAINACDPTEPFRRLDAASRHDLLSSHVQPADSGWFWHRSMTGQYPAVQRCFFPVVRLSGAAIDRLHAVRAAEGGSYAARERDGGLAPNDEAFVATVLAAEGFSSADFNDFGAFYDRASFGFDTLFNAHALPPRDGRFYHAVLRGDAYLEKLGRMAVLDAGAIIEAARHDPALRLEDCAACLLRALHAELGGQPDEARLVEAGSLVGRALGLADGETLLPGVAQCLADLGRVRALARLKALWPAQLAQRPGPFPNVARHKPALQSSTCAWSRHGDPAAEAAGANDGDRLSACGCHTDEEIDPWWQVDLGATHEIHAIEIENRRHMAQRLAGFRIDASPDGRTWQAIHRDGGGAPTPVAFQLPFDPPVCGRFLRITVPGRAILHIVEFAAFGRPAEPE